MLSELTRGLLDLVFPPRCAGCRRYSDRSIICLRCRDRLEPCGSLVLVPQIPEGVLYPRALWQFTEAGPVRNILHQLKYSNAPWLGGHIGSLIADLVPTDAPWPEAGVIPVPLSPTKRIERGYNQSGWIAEGLASAVGCRVFHEALARRRATRSQTTLRRGQRLSNVGGAFRAEPDRVRDEHIILVDDTITTGATILECAQTLRSAGARMVLPLAAASAPLRAAVEPHLTIPVLAS